MRGVFSLALCAILKGSAQIFWSLQRMPLNPRAFQAGKVLVCKLCVT
jgi:hypothetical protein